MTAPQQPVIQSTTKFEPTRKVHNETQSRGHGKVRFTRSVALKPYMGGFTIASVTSIHRWANKDRIRTSQQIANRGDIIICSILEIYETVQAGPKAKSKAAKAAKPVNHKSWTAMYSADFDGTGKPKDKPLDINLQNEIWQHIREKFPKLYKWMDLDNPAAVTFHDHMDRRADHSFLPAGLGWDGITTDTDRKRTISVRERLPNLYSSGSFEKWANHFDEGLLASPHKAVCPIWDNRSKDVAELSNTWYTGAASVIIRDPMASQSMDMGFVCVYVVAKKNTGRNSPPIEMTKVYVPPVSKDLGERFGSLALAGKFPHIDVNDCSVGAIVGELQGYEAEKEFGFKPDFLMVAYFVIVPGLYSLPGVDCDFLRGQVADHYLRSGASTASGIKAMAGPNQLPFLGVTMYRTQPKVKRA